MAYYLYTVKQPTLFVDIKKFIAAKYILQLTDL